MNLISISNDDDDDDDYPRLEIRLQKRILCNMFTEIVNEVCCLPYVQHFIHTMFKVAAISCMHNSRMIIPTMQIKFWLLFGRMYKK